jgi:hypothetical protein
MNLLPGWNSVETTTRLHDFFEIAGIVFLALLVVAEVLAYMYGHQRDWLISEADRIFRKNLAEYGEVVILNYQGSRSISDTHSVRTPLSGWNDKYIRDTNSGKQIRNDNEAIEYYKKTSGGVPKVPLFILFSCRGVPTTGRWQMARLRQ